MEDRKTLLFIWIALFGMLMIQLGVYAYAIGELKILDAKMSYMLQDLDLMMDETKKPRDFSRLEL